MLTSSVCPNCANCLYTRPIDPDDLGRIGERLTGYCYTCPYLCPVSWLMKKGKNDKTKEDSDSDSGSDDRHIGVKFEREKAQKELPEHDIDDDTVVGNATIQHAAVEDVVEDAAVEGASACHPPANKILSFDPDDILWQVIIAGVNDEIYRL